MSETLQKILQESINLSVLERVQLLDELYKTFDVREDSTITQQWANEAEEQLEAFKRGEIAAEDYESIKLHLK